MKLTTALLALTLLNSITSTYAAPLVDEVYSTVYSREDEDSYLQSMSDKLNGAIVTDQLLNDAEINSNTVEYNRLVCHQVDSLLEVFVFASANLQYDVAREDYFKLRRELIDSLINDSPVTTANINCF